MYFQTLENTSLTQLTDLFNAAFADYFVKVKLTPEHLEEKMYSEDIDLKISMGIFDNEKPVGFMLHGLREIDGKKVAYNAGTGVVKEYRGQNATEKMYEKLNPILKSKGISEVILEVISQNAAAIRSYEKAGFTKVAGLACFKGDVKVPTPNEQIEVKELENIDLEKVRDFSDWQATWQHSEATIRKMEDLIFQGAFLKNELVGFLIGQKSRARVYQFAVDHEYRMKGIGQALFYAFAQSMKSEISVINVDDPSGNSQQFLRKIGLTSFLSQDEMKLKL